MSPRDPIATAIAPGHKTWLKFAGQTLSLQRGLILRSRLSRRVDCLEIRDPRFRQSSRLKQKSNYEDVPDHNPEQCLSDRLALRQIGCCANDVSAYLGVPGEFSVPTLSLPSRYSIMFVSVVRPETSLKPATMMPSILTWHLN